MRLVMKLYIIFTTRVHSTMGRCMSVNRGRGKGYPWPLVPGHFLGGRGYSQFCHWSCPKSCPRSCQGEGEGGIPVLSYAGVPKPLPQPGPRQGYLPLPDQDQDQNRGTLSPPPGQDQDRGPPPHSTRRGQDRSRVVRLLQSHRRTFLFYTISLQNCHVLPQSLNQQI